MWSFLHGSLKQELPCRIGWWKYAFKQNVNKTSSLGNQKKIRYRYYLFHCFQCHVFSCFTFTVPQVSQMSRFWLDGTNVNKTSSLGNQKKIKKQVVFFHCFQCHVFSCFMFTVPQVSQMSRFWLDQVNFHFFAILII